MNAETPESSATIPLAHPCEHAGCTAPGIGVYLNGGASAPDAWYCYTHMTEEGVCWGCLYFCAGLEAFDFSTSGLCGECQDNPDVTGEDPDDEDDDWPEWYEDLW